MYVRRRLARLLAVALFASPLVVLTGSPASADLPCNPYAFELVCLDQSGWSIRGRLTCTRTCALTNVTVAVLQCRGDGSHCEDWMATHATLTPWKEMVPGHAYRTVASWHNATYGYDAVYILSDWRFRPCPC